MRFVSLLLWWVLVFAASEVIGASVEDAESALDTGGPEAGLDAYLAALDTQPENLAALEVAADLAAQLDIDELSLELSIQRANVAAAKGDKAVVRQANSHITSLHQAVPPWVDEQIAIASEYEPADAGIAEDWQSLTREAQYALEQGDIDTALAAQESALLIVDETFGPEHWFTIASLRDLGSIYRHAGQGAEADAYYGAALSAAEQVLGPDHPRTLEILGLLAELYIRAGDPGQGLAMNEMTIAGYGETVGPDHAWTTDARLRHVRGLELAGDYEAALAEARDLCGDIERAWGRFHEKNLACLETLASVEMTSGQLTDAETTWLEVSKIMGATLPRLDARVLENLAQLGEVYRYQGRYNDAIGTLSDVIALAVQSGNEAAAMTGRAYLGRVLTNTGELEAARVLTEEVLDYGLDNWQSSPLMIYNTLLELGAVYQALGRLAEAEATFAEAYEGLLDLYGPDHPSTLVAMNNLGQVYEAIGLYDEAEPVLELALAQFEKTLGETHPDTLRARNNLALLLESQGNFREAEPLYARNLELMIGKYGENYTDTVAVRNNLAFLYMLMEEYDTSAEMFEQVMNRWIQLLGPEHQNTFKAINNLGRVYLAMGRLDEAVPLFERALAGRGEVLGENHVDTIRSMVDYADLMLAQGRLAAAEELATDALSRAESVLTEQHPYTFDALNLLRRIRQAQGDIAAAVEIGQKTLARRSVFFDRMLWTTGQNAREGYLRLHRPELDAYLSLLAASDDEDRGRRVVEASLQRKGLLLKITSEIQQIARMSEDPALSSLVSELETARKELAALTLSGPTEETGERHAEVLYQLEQRVNDLQAQLGRASERYRTSIAQVSTDTLEVAMADGSALIDFLAYNGPDGTPKLMAGIAVKEDGDVRYALVDYPDRSAVEEAVITYRGWIQDDLATEFDIIDTGRMAWDAIWSPLTSAIEGVEHVYVVPDGALNILPFAALVDEDEEFLIQQHDLQLLTSTRDLLPSPFRLAEGDYIIVAGPDYDASDLISQDQLESARGRRSSEMQLGIRGAGRGLRGLNFAPLPGATEEGRIITEQVEQKDEPNIVFFGDDAQEVVLNRMERPPEILHMATHGFFLEADEGLRKRLLRQQRGAELHVPPPGDNPLLRSGLAFAGVNANAPYLGDIDTDNDGVLTALEVLDLDLSGTQLVVLSACETGLGEIHEGEGVYGLRRSFQESGVAEVVSSLWEVSDEGTQALMTRFYDRILAGQPARRALRDAQLELMDSPRWGYPYIWAAFMIVGSYESAGFSVN